MEDKSIIKNTDIVDVDATYINDLIKEVCLKGDSQTKYKRMIEKRYGAEFYQKCGYFVKEVKRSVNRKKFTQTSIANLNHLANEIDVTSSTIETLIDHYIKKFTDDASEEEKAVRKRVKHEEEEKKVTALMKKVAEAEDKRLGRVIEEEKRGEGRKRKAVERRKRAGECHRQKKLEEEKLRIEEEKRQKDQNAKRQHEEERDKMIAKWLIVVAIVVIALCVFIPSFRYVVAEIIGGLLALVVVVYIIYSVLSFIVGLFE